MYFVHINAMYHVCCLCYVFQMYPVYYTFTADCCDYC